MSLIKNKCTRVKVFQKQKRAKSQQKLNNRLAQAKAEANDPVAKKVCLFSHSFYISMFGNELILLGSSCKECTTHARQYTRTGSLYPTRSCRYFGWTRPFRSVLLSHIWPLPPTENPDHHFTEANEGDMWLLRGTHWSVSRRRFCSKEERGDWDRKHRKLGFRTRI